MSELAADLMAAVAKVGPPKVLILDIETSPTLTYTFGMRPKWISPDKIVEPSRMLCWGAQWLDQKRILFKSEHHHERADMIQTLWDLLDQADIVVTFNGDRFDLPIIMREFFDAGLTRPKPFQSVDLYKSAKKMQRESNSLNHLAKCLDLGQKVEHAGFSLWKRCLAGDKAAWTDMKRYQLGDITLTKAVYLHMRKRGWIANHPHTGLFTGEERSCWNCSGTDLTATGLVRTARTAYASWVCNDCGSHSRNNHRKRIVTLVPVH